VPAGALGQIDLDVQLVAPGQVSTAPWSSWRDRPLYTQAGDLVTDRSIQPEQYGDFLIGVFEEWVRRDVGVVYVQMFDVALANWVGEPSGLCVHSKTCGLALAIEHNGDLYSCDHFVEPAYQTGQHPGDADDRVGSLAAAAEIWRRQVRHAARVLPGVRRTFCLSRRLSEGSLF
jgi:sulfatase maturation enzyme AslB (radical SAM superfamily)